MTDPNIVRQNVHIWTVNFDRINSDNMNKYRSAFAAFVAANGGLAEPDPPLLIVYDENKAFSDEMAWSDSLQAAVSTGSQPLPRPTLPITYIQAARLQKPAPPPPPSEIVGPAMGVNDDQGRPMYYTVSGDNSPLGTTDSDARGFFVKSGHETPFGVESYWALLPPVTGSGTSSVLGAGQ